MLDHSTLAEAIWLVEKSKTVSLEDRKVHSKRRKNVPLDVFFPWQNAHIPPVHHDGTLQPRNIVIHTYYCSTWGKWPKGIIGRHRSGTVLYWRYDRVKVYGRSTSPFSVAIGRVGANPA